MDEIEDYITHTIKKSSDYAEYVAEQTYSTGSYSYAEGMPIKVDIREEKRKLRKKKLESVLVRSTE